jgi:transcriptional regulator with XRE-family HTH domain
MPRRGAVAAKAIEPEPRVDDVEQTVRAIGPRLKALRAELGMSLQQMSVIADVSAASIHKIERGEMVPTITTLLKLASTLHRPLSYFVDEPGDAGDVWYTAGGTGEVLGDESAVRTVKLSGPPLRFRGEASVSRLAPGGQVSVERKPPGEVLLFVVGGTVEVDVAGRRFTLRKGDALHHLSDRPSVWSNLGKTAAEVLCHRQVYQ